MKEYNNFNPLVSIIIPVYNGGNYMKEAIDSAISQTYKNVEIIVVNDGSRDEGQTEQIAKEYGNKIRYIYKENGGVSTALNTGINAMTGEYFSWLSHDDIYTPHKVEKSVVALSKVEDKKTIICCEYVHMDKNSQMIASHNKRHYKLTQYSWEDALMKLIKKGSMNGCALLIHKDILLECGLFDESLRFNQDGFMWNKIFLKKYPYICIPDICVKNRIHGKQLTQTGQHIFHSDCEKMSEFLIPELLKVSSREKNFIVEYIKYNAKYANFNIVNCSYEEAKVKKLIGIKDGLSIRIWKVYGAVRPMIRDIYYKLFRKM